MTSTIPAFTLAHLPSALADELEAALMAAQDLHAELQRSHEAMDAASAHHLALCEAHRAADRRLVTVMKRATLEVLGPEAVAYLRQRLQPDVPLGAYDFTDDELPF